MQLPVTSRGYMNIRKDVLPSANLYTVHPFEHKSDRRMKAEKTWSLTMAFFDIFKLTEFLQNITGHKK